MLPGMVTATDTLDGPAMPGVVRFGREGRLSTLETELRLARPRAEVFPFFADAFNLEAITPASIRFAILTPPPIVMRKGLLIDYRLHLLGMPLGWTSEITEWDPPRAFVDEQRRGPYRVWIHRHEFEEYDGGTRVRDRVRYAVPGGAAVDRLIVRPQLLRIFTWRRARIAELLGSAAS